jgi:hypothetical protein
MKISKETSDFNDATSYTIDLDGTENAEFREILEGWLDALEYHEFKSRGYKNRRIFSLGIRGEFVGFWRKAQKLYSSIWEKEGLLVGEGVQEVLMDTFGSVGLMLHDYRKTSDKYRANWRDNHGNKPTFGPDPLGDGITVHGKQILDEIAAGARPFPSGPRRGFDGRCQPQSGLLGNSLFNRRRAKIAFSRRSR